MKQLGLALQNYHSARDKFPFAPITVGASIPRLRGRSKFATGMAWYSCCPIWNSKPSTTGSIKRCCVRRDGGQSSLLCSTTSRGTLMGSPVSSGNAQLSTEMIAGLLCPSDDGEIRLPLGGHYSAASGYGGAKTNYEFSASSRYECKYWQTQPENERRLFGDRSHSAIRMSLTVCRTRWHSPRPCVQFIMATRRPGRIVVGSCWESTSVRTRSTFTPAGRHCQPRAIAVEVVLHAGSMHGNGANVVMADGSVHYLADDTEPLVLEAISTMAGEEVANSALSSHVRACQKK